MKLNFEFFSWNFESLKKDNFRKIMAATQGTTLAVGYWKIRGLASPLRMLCEYSGASWTNEAYASDDSKKWCKEFEFFNIVSNFKYILKKMLLIRINFSC